MGTCREVRVRKLKYGDLPGGKSKKNKCGDLSGGKSQILTEMWGGRPARMVVMTKSIKKTETERGKY